MLRIEPDFSPSNETAKIAAMMTRWHQLIDLHKNADLWIAPERIDRFDARIDRQLNTLTDRIVEIGIRRLGSPAQNFDDVAARALLAIHTSAEAGRFPEPATPSALRKGSASWELPRAILTLAGFNHLAR